MHDMVAVFNMDKKPYKDSRGIESTAMKEFAGVKNKIKRKNRNGSQSKG